MGKTPNWLHRVLSEIWLIGVHGQAFNSVPRIDEPSAWIWYLEWRLWRKFEYLARAARISAEYYGSYGAESALGRDNLDMNRRLIRLSDHHQGWRGLRRRAQFGPGSLAGTNWATELQTRCLVGAFIRFDCENCGNSGSAERTQIVDWESGEGFGMTWGKRRECGNCGAQLSSLPLRTLK